MGAEIVTYMGSTGSNYYGSTQAHLTGFITAMGVPPVVVGNAVASNYGSGNGGPTNWPGTASGQAGAAAALSPKPAAISLTMAWQDNSGNNLYNDMATVTNTLYGGQLVAYWVQQMLAAINAAGFSICYLRPMWEWNINGNGFGIGASGITPAVFVQAFQKFWTTCHNYASANGMTVYVCWNASVDGNPDTYGYTLAEQFPGNTGCDIVMSDFYAEGGLLASTTSSDPTAWVLPSMVSLAAGAGLPIGFGELGGIVYPNGGTTAANVGTWIPNLVSYINSLNGSPPVALAQLYDINTNIGSTSNLEWTAPGAGQSTIITAWKNALGPGGSMKTLPV